MKVDVVTLDNKIVSQIELSSEIFGQALRKDIIQRVVRWQLAKRQAGTHKTKVVSDVQGTTAKPFKQKGTGRARQGTKRAVQMRGGGISFGPVVRSHAHDLPKKIRQLGLKVAISAKLSEGKLFIIKDAKLKDNKAKTLAAHLKQMNWNSALLIDGDVDINLKQASSNLHIIDVLPTIGANVYDILRKDVLILTEDCVKKLEERLA